MKFNPKHCAINSFEDHVLRQGQIYDYVWCGADVDVHTHKDFYELFILSGGDFIHYCEGKEQKIAKNTICFFKPGVSHGLYKVSQQSAHFSFFAKENYFERFFEENAFLKNVFGKHNYIICELTDIEYEYIYKLANSLMYRNDERQMVSLFLYNAISLLMLHNRTMSNEVKNVYVVDLVEKLNNFTYLNTEINEIYNEYPIARCTLIKEFREYTGMTIVQYQKKQKLTYATQLLSNSKCQITEIAEILGYDSFSYFLRIFKEEYGLTPKEYRKKRLQ